MSLLGWLFGSTEVETSQYDKYNVMGYNQGTRFSEFTHSEIEQDLDCCENPEPFTEMCDFPSEEMFYGGVCRNCSRIYTGLIHIDVEVNNDE